MTWVVDTSVALDVIVTNSEHRLASATCLQRHLSEGLCVCPITLVELGPAFGGNAEAAETFLQTLLITVNEPWTRGDSVLAHKLWYEHQLRRRQLNLAKRPVADVLIAAFASRFQGIITRNASDFRSIAPSLFLIEP